MVRVFAEGRQVLGENSIKRAEELLSHLRWQVVDTGGTASTAAARKLTTEGVGVFEVVKGCPDAYP